MAAGLLVGPWLVVRRRVGRFIALVRRATVEHRDAVESCALLGLLTLITAGVSLLSGGQADTAPHGYSLSGALAPTHRAVGTAFHQTATGGSRVQHPAGVGAAGVAGGGQTAAAADGAPPINLVAVGTTLVVAVGRLLRRAAPLEQSGLAVVFLAAAAGCWFARNGDQRRSEPVQPASTADAADGVVTGALSTNELRVDEKPPDDDADQLPGPDTDITPAVPRPGNPRSLARWSVTDAGVTAAAQPAAPAAAAAHARVAAECGQAAVRPLMTGNRPSASVDPQPADTRVVLLDRRANQRIPYSETAVVRWNGVEYPVTTVDLSIGGVGCRISPLSLTNPLTRLRLRQAVQILLPVADGIVELAARVAWRRGVTNGLDIGLAFHGLPAEQVRRLEALVASHRGADSLDHRAT